MTLRRYLQGNSSSAPSVEAWLLCRNARQDLEPTNSTRFLRGNSFHNHAEGTREVGAVRTQEEGRLGRGAVGKCRSDQEVGEDHLREDREECSLMAEVIHHDRKECQELLLRGLFFHFFAA